MTRAIRFEKGASSSQYNLIEKITAECPNVLKALRAEGYELEFLVCDVFEPIRFEDETVGFLAFKRFGKNPYDIALTETYIIPRARGNGLLANHLYSFHLLDNLVIYSRRPTKDFINFLLKEEYAFKLSDDLVYSYMDFAVDIDEVYFNSKIRRYYNIPDNTITYTANLFDLNLCSAMFFDDFIKNDNFLAMTKPRKQDFKKYKLKKKLKKVSKKYIEEKYNLYHDNFDKINEFRQKSDKEMSEIYDVEYILGTEDELSESFKETLDNFNLTEEDGFKIIAHINERLASGELSLKSFFLRHQYLLFHIDETDKEIPDYDESLSECLFCGQKIPEVLNSCVKCGLHVRNHDLTGSVGKVKIKKDDELYDLKTFYNRYLTDFDFNEICSFYREIQENLEIPEIIDLYINDKLDKNSDFKTYYYYICYHYNYSFTNKNYDDAMIYMMQLMISPPKYIREWDSVKIFDAMADLTSLNYDFDIDILFERAVESYKLPEYIEQTETVLEIFKYSFTDGTG